MVALFADLLGLPTDDRYPPLPPDPQLRRERVIAASIRHLEGLARQRPVLLIFEDAHWINSSSLSLLDFFTDRVPHLAVLMVVSFRPDFRAPWGARACEQRGTEPIGPA